MRGGRTETDREKEGRASSHSIVRRSTLCFFVRFFSLRPSILHRVPGQDGRPAGRALSRARGPGPGPNREGRGRMGSGNGMQLNGPISNNGEWEIRSPVSFAVSHSRAGRKCTWPKAPSLLSVWERECRVGSALNGAAAVDMKNLAGFQLYYTGSTRQSADRVSRPQMQTHARYRVASSVLLQLPRSCMRLPRLIM